MTRFPRKPGRALAALLLALAAGAALRLYLANHCSPFGSDSFHYMELARGLAEEGRYASRGSQHPDLSRYPLLPVLMAAGATLGLSYENAGRTVVFFASLLVAIPLWFLAREAFGRRSALPAAALGALSCLAGGATLMYPDPLYALIVASLAAALLRTLHRCTRGAAAATGGFAVLATLTRPEGILWALVAMAVAGFAAVRVARRTPRRWLPLALVIAITLPSVLVHVAWVSVGLQRLCFNPGIEYVRSVREVGDHYGVRRFDVPGAPWEVRASYLLDRNRTGYVLAERFASGTFPPADSRWVEPVPERVKPDATRKQSWAPASLKLRLFIAVRSATLLPGSLRSAHLLPPVPVALGLLGCITAARSRKGRRGLASVVGAVLLTLVPMVSHIEERFLLSGLVLASAIAGRGWASLDLWLARAAWRFRLIRAAVHALLALGIAASTAAHVRHCPRPMEREAFFREAGRALARVAPRGPVLSILPHVPWFGDRPYRRLPLGGPEEARDYGHATGAAAIVLNLPTDRERRPDLGSLLDLPPPQGFRVADRVEGPDGSEIRLLVIDDGAAR